MLKRHFSKTLLSAKEYVANLALLRDVCKRNGHFLSVGSRQRNSLEHLQAASDNLLDARKLSRSTRRNCKTRQIYPVRTLHAAPAPYGLLACTTELARNGRLRTQI